MDKVFSKIDKWKKSDTKVFWGEIAPCDHLVQFYENDDAFLNTLEGFAGGGFLEGDSVVIIATSGHLNALNERLTRLNFDINSLIAANQYFPLTVEEVLSKFMVNNWPDEELFTKFISSLIQTAENNNRKIRAFGEMVAILWEQGLNGATVQLEHLWNQLHNKRPFVLYCAYPKIGYTQHAIDSIKKICKSHSKIIDGKTRPATEIYYKTA